MFFLANGFFLWGGDTFSFIFWLVPYQGPTIRTQHHRLHQFRMGSRDLDTLPFATSWSSGHAVYKIYRPRTICLVCWFVGLFRLSVCLFVCLICLVGWLVDFCLWFVFLVVCGLFFGCLFVCLSAWLIVYCLLLWCFCFVGTHKLDCTTSCSH